MGCVPDIAGFASFAVRSGSRIGRRTKACRASWLVPRALCLVHCVRGACVLRLTWNFLSRPSYFVGCAS